MIDTATWRQRIGVFTHPRPWRSNASTKHSTFSLSGVTLFIFLTCTLFLSGDVETNPGPSSNLISLTERRRNYSKFNTTIPLSSNTANIKVAYVNIQSLSKKTEEFRDLILKENFDCVILTETWLTEETHDIILSRTTPDGYISKSLPRSSRGGGIAFIYKDCFKRSSPPSIFKYNNHGTYEAAQFYLNLPNHQISIICVYRPPPSPTNNITNSKTVTELEELFIHLHSLSHFILLGDFNFHYDSTECFYSRLLKATIDETNLTQHIDVPTQIHGHTLDWVISPKADSTCIPSDITVIDSTLSDHFLITFYLTTQKPETQRKSITSRNNKNIDLHNFKKDINDSLCHLSKQTADTLNISLREVLDQHAPLTTRKVSSRPPAPWFCSEIKTAKQRRRAAEKTWIKSGFKADREAFVASRRAVNKLVKACKRQYFLNKFNSISTCKELFKETDSLLSKNKDPVYPAKELSELPGQFLDFFITKIEQIRYNLDLFNAKPSFSIFSGVPLNNFHEVKANDVYKLITSCSSKSCIIDPIPTNLVKETLPVLLPYLTSVINDSLMSGVVPECYKKALVSPIIKKPTLDPNDLNNYRPVSNLPYFSKVLERIVLKQLLNHINTFKLNEELQSAYKMFHSTETANLRVYNDLLINTDDRNISLLVLLDLSAAFDTIDHNILLDRLNITYGFQGTVIAWLRSYLSNRHQAVKINNFTSENVRLKFGVPQGSVLGPVLFTLYVQPIVDIIKKYGLSYHLYADDTQLYGSVNPADLDSLKLRMQSCISEIKTWMTVNKLQLNDKKTEVMVIYNKFNIKIPPVVTLNINGCLITSVNQVKSLGVILDSNLSMAAFISKIRRDAFFQLKRIALIRKCLTIKVTNTLILSLVMSKIDYCNSLLAGVPHQLISKIQTVQNYAARIVLKKNKYESATYILKTLHWLPITKRIEYKLAVTTFNCLNDIAPGYLRDLLTLYVPSRSLRSASDTTLLIIPKTKYKTIGERSFYSCAPSLWNDIPKRIRQSNSKIIFKKELKYYLFKSFYK